MRYATCHQFVINVMMKTANKDDSKRDPQKFEKVKE